MASCVEFPLMSERIVQLYSVIPHSSLKLFTVKMALKETYHKLLLKHRKAFLIELFEPFYIVSSVKFLIKLFLYPGKDSDKLL